MIEGPSKIHAIDLDLIVPSPYQSRQVFDQTALEELAASIKIHGIIHPIIVRAIGNGQYELIAGERRWRASQLAQKSTIDAIVRDISDEQACQLNTVENISRVDLNPIEEGHAYRRLIDDFHYTHEEVGDIVGKSRAKITNLLRLLTLASSVQEGIANQLINESQGKLLVGLPSDQQISLYEQCVARRWSQRQLEGAVQAIKSGKQLRVHEQDNDMRVLERGLSEYLGCQTHIDFRQGSGVLKIHFHDVDVLQGVLQKLGYETSDISQ